MFPELLFVCFCSFLFFFYRNSLPLKIYLSLYVCNHNIHTNIVTDIHLQKLERLIQKQRSYIKHKYINIVLHFYNNLWYSPFRGNAPKEVILCFCFQNSFSPTSSLCGGDLTVRGHLPNPVGQSPNQILPWGFDPYNQNLI